MTDELLVFGVAGALILMAVIAVVFVVRRRWALIAELREVDRVLELLAANAASASGLVAAIREHVVRDETPSGKRYVLNKPLAVVRREYAEGEVAHSPSFVFGGVLTAFALICTFLLIAWVMTTDVSGAIKNEADSSQLSSAVAKLGAKFLISAAGIFGSVLALFFSNSARGAIYRAAEHPPMELLAHFSSVDAEMLSAKLHELELARDDREARARDTAARAEESARATAHLASLDARAQKLNSIEVSLQTIGNEVSANLKNIMKDAMAEELRGIMSDMMVDVQGMATKLEEQLTDGFRSSLHAMSSDLKKALDAVQKAIEGQAQGQLDKILEQLHRRDRTSAGGERAGRCAGHPGPRVAASSDGRLRGRGDQEAQRRQRAADPAHVHSDLGVDGLDGDAADRERRRSREVADRERARRPGDGEALRGQRLEPGEQRAHVIADRDRRDRAAVARFRGSVREAAPRRRGTCEPCGRGRHEGRRRALDLGPVDDRARQRHGDDSEERPAGQ
ncbi:MAG: hypothetical protein NT062_11810 [Proteobacteria bacterium]|nr:hypothetical protein [Pseudomonadota bacterium]